jgi:hypothetical protein
MMVAEKVQNGKMTIVEGNAAVAEKWSQAVSESQRRRNATLSVAAQQEAAAAQGSAASASWAAMNRSDLHAHRQYDNLQLSSRPRCRFANRQRDVCACDVYRLWWHSSRRSQDGQAFRARLRSRTAWRCSPRAAEHRGVKTKKGPWLCLGDVAGGRARSVVRQARATETMD